METKEHYIYFIKRHTYVRATGDDKSPIETTQEVNEHRNKHFPPSCSKSNNVSSHAYVNDYPMCVDTRRVMNPQLQASLR